MLVASKLPIQTTKIPIAFWTCICAPHFEKGSFTTGPGHSWKYSNNRLRSRIYSPWPNGLSSAEIDLVCL